MEKKLNYKEEYKNFLSSANIYIEVQDFWREIVTAMIGDNFQSWVDNQYENGEDIMDGNPIFSCKASNRNQAIRLILIKRDLLLPVFSSWNSSYQLHDSLINELVVSIQPYKETFADTEQLIRMFFKNRYKKFQKDLNIKYKKFNYVGQVYAVRKTIRDAKNLEKINEETINSIKFDKIYRRIETLKGKMRLYENIAYDSRMEKGISATIKSLSKLEKVVNNKQGVYSSIKLDSLKQNREIGVSLQRYFRNYNNAVKHLEKGLMLLEESLKR